MFAWNSTAKGWESKTREGRADEAGGAVCSLQFAVCAVRSPQSVVCRLLVLDTKAVELHRTESDWCRSSRTARLVGLDGTGFEFEEGGTPQMAASPSGGRGEQPQAGWRVQDVVQVCKCAVASGADRQYLQEMDCQSGDKVVPELCKRIGRPAKPGSPGFPRPCGRSARPRVGDGRKVAGSPEQCWYLGAFRLRKFTSSIGARNGEATGRNHRKSQKTTAAELFAQLVGRKRCCRAIRIGAGLREEDDRH